MRRRAFLDILKPYRGLYLAILFTSLAVAVLEALNVATVLPLFNSLLDAGQANAVSNPLTRLILKLLELIPIGDKVTAACLLLLGGVLLKGILGILNEFLIGYSGGKILYDTRKSLAQKHAGMSYASLLEVKHGELLYYALTSPFKLAEVFRKAPLMMAEFLKILAIAALLFSLNPWVTLAMGALGLVFNLAISYLSKNVSTNLGQARAEAYASLSTTFSELMNGLKTIRVYGSEGRWLSHYDRANRDYSRIFTKDAVLLALPKNLLEVFGLGIVFGFLLIFQMVRPGAMLEAIPMLGLFGLAILKLLPATSTFSRTRLELATCLPEAETVRQILERESDGPRFGTRPFRGLERGVEFNNVRFAHKGRPELMKGIDIKIEKNKLTAITGDSGAGKTTLVNLLLGLHEPTSGEILVDGVPLRELKLKDWLSRIGFVSQDPFIFHSTVAENISLGDTRFSPEDIRAAARAAYADDFISALPQGYDTIVGEKGMKLSGGQQQRITIARAILRKPDLLIFDEATSHLDNLSERIVQRAIQNISKNHTVLVIAHRLITILHADKIAYLAEGRVVEEGTHDELVQRKGRYFHRLNAVLSRDPREEPAPAGEPS